MIQETLVDNLETKEYKVKQAEDRDVPPNMPNLHFLSLIAGSRGSGKTNAMLRLVELYDTTKSFDKVILFCPTKDNDPKYDLLSKGSYHFESYDHYAEDFYTGCFGRYQN